MPSSARSRSISACSSEIARYAGFARDHGAVEERRPIQMKSAPSASALMTSVLRRMPPSIITVMLPFSAAISGSVRSAETVVELAASHGWRPSRRRSRARAPAGRLPARSALDHELAGPALADQLDSCFQASWSRPPMLRIRSRTSTGGPAWRPCSRNAACRD